MKLRDDDKNNNKTKLENNQKENNDNNTNLTSDDVDKNKSRSNDEVRGTLISKVLNFINGDNDSNEEDTNQENSIDDENENLEETFDFDELSSVDDSDDDSDIANIHKNHRSRLKKQYRDNGGNVLTEIQILELLLFYAIPQKDTNPIAHRLIDKFGSVKNVLSADIETLMTVNGIKENSATLISLVNSLFRYIMTPATGTKLDSVTEATKYCNELFKGVDVEQFYVICLTKSSIVKSVRLIQSGTSDEVAIQMRSITEFAIESKCNRIIITHNHPYGRAVMSDEDCSFTFSLVCSCLLNSIDVLDHIIISPESGYSMAQEHVLKQLKEKAIKNVNLPVSILRLISSDEEEYILE